MVEDLKCLVIVSLVIATVCSYLRPKTNFLKLSDFNDLTSFHNLFPGTNSFVSAQNGYTCKTLKYVQK